MGEGEKELGTLEIDGVKFDMPVSTMDVNIEIIGDYDAGSLMEFPNGSIKIYFSRWDAFKDRFFPKWLNKRFPIKSFSGIIRAICEEAEKGGDGDER